MSERAMRPFWIHQLAEYLIGAALVAQGMQDTEPLLPTLAGVLVIVNAAIVHGPLGAFRWIRRRQHRWLDLAVLGAIVAVAVQPWLQISTTGRAVLAVVLVPLGFLWFYTDWAERPDRRHRRAARASVRSESVGRSAGRLAGSAYSAAKSATRRRADDS